MLTEEEICDLKGTDSDGTPIDLARVFLPKLGKITESNMFTPEVNAGLKKSDEPGILTKTLRRGWRVDAAHARTPDSARLFRARFPF